MALQSLSQIVSDVFMGLGKPPVDWLDPEQITREVLRVTGLDTQILSQSSENQIIQNCVFTPSRREWTISNAISLGVPAWMEREVWSGQYAAWQFIPLVNLAMVDDNYMRGVMSCAIYGQSGQLKVRFSYNPQTLPYRRHRLWYDPAPQLAQTLTAADVGTLFNGIPEAYAPMLSGQAIENLIPLMMSQAAMSEQKPDESLIKAWGLLLAQIKVTNREWKDRYSHFCYGSRGAARSRRRRNILSKGGGIPFGFPGYR